jgi:hypothetical protein
MICLKRMLEKTICIMLKPKFGSPLIEQYLFIIPPIIKCLGHYVMAYASVSVNIWFPSVIGQMPRSIDPIFLWLFGGD